MIDLRGRDEPDVPRISGARTIALDELSSEPERNRNPAPATWSLSRGSSPAVLISSAGADRARKRPAWGGRVVRGRDRPSGQIEADRSPEQLRTLRRYPGSWERRSACGVTITPSAGYRIDSCCSSQRTR